MIALGYSLLVIYCICVLCITTYCVLQADLLAYYRKKKPNAVFILPNPAPLVTIQLPLYNEKYVVDRLIDNIMKMDYPKDSLQVQVIDDSDDETVDIIAKKVVHYKSLGFNIDHVRREVRKGFKAGALKDATPFATGDFLAIFDADFVPKTDFLQKTIPHFFKDPHIGVVQTRWEHLNENYSTITALQAMQLNVHFTVEQAGRARGGLFLQFNGTAGVWRKATIADAGGWHDDTLTEDLDLSYRAQSRGWKIEYLEEVGSPAELPAGMNALLERQRCMPNEFQKLKGIFSTTFHPTELLTFQAIHISRQLSRRTNFLKIFNFPTS